MTQLEQEVLCIINETIEGCYTGKLSVVVSKPEKECGELDCRPTNDTIYTLYLYLDRWFTPIVLSYEGTEFEFKEFIRQEFKKNKYEKIHFYKITREPIVLDEETVWDDEQE